MPERWAPSSGCIVAPNAAGTATAAATASVVSASDLIARTYPGAPAGHHYELLNRPACKKRLTMRSGRPDDNVSMSTVLVVDDEPIVRDVVVRYLEQEGYRTLQAADGEEARGVLERERPSLVVLDLMLPGTDGLSLCRWIRERSDLPVIMVTALGEEADRLTGLELGADDYLTKPFSPRELVARVKAVLRRASRPGAVGDRVEIGDLTVDARRREARRNGSPLRLTALEFDLLWFLATNPDRVFSRRELMDEVWGYTSALDTGTVTVHVRRLREKIEDDPSKPRHLETVWGSGYRFTK
jgi:DNA-binding response OmpR family regulator